MRNLFKYSRFYFGGNPQLCEGDVFRIIVPLDESYSYDYALSQKHLESGTNGTDFSLENFTVEEHTIIQLVKSDASLTQKKIQEKTGYSIRSIKRMMAKLQDEGIITRVGSSRSGKWQEVCTL